MSDVVAERDSRVVHAVVLSGGASRGAYQIGVWKALEEAGVRCSVVSGASIGALNAALMAMNDLERGERTWLGLENRQIFSLNVETLKAMQRKGAEVLDAWKRDRWEEALAGVFKAFEEWKEKGLFDLNPLRRIVEEEIDPDLVRRSGIDCYVCHHRNGKIEYPNLRELNRKECFDVLTASCVLGFLYPVLFRDGDAMGHAPAGTLPLEPVRSRGADIVWVVHLDPAGKPAHGAGRFFTFNLYPSCNFAQDITGGYLVVKTSVLKDWIQCGYADMIDLIEDIKAKTKLEVMSDWVLRSNQSKIAEILERTGASSPQEVEEARKRARAAMDSL